MSEFALRPGRESDHPFVVDSWLTSNETSPRARELIEAGVYWTEWKRMVRRLLADAGNRLMVATLPDDEDAILGWACTSHPPPENPDPLVFYVYVKGKFGQSARRLGIASALLAEFLPHPCTYTHRPARGQLPIPQNFFYNPERNYR